MGEEQKPTRIVIEELEHDFAVEQINSYIDHGLDVYVDMAPMQVALLVERAVTDGSHIRIAFADTKIPAKPVRGEAAVKIYLLRP